MAAASPSGSDSRAVGRNDRYGFGPNDTPAMTPGSEGWTGGEGRKTRVGRSDRACVAGGTKPREGEGGVSSRVRGRRYRAGYGPGQAYGAVIRPWPDHPKTLVAYSRRSSAGSSYTAMVP